MARIVRFIVRCRMKASTVTLALDDGLVLPKCQLAAPF